MEEKNSSQYEIVFTGRSNVGKSSLIRKLTGQKVRIGKRPGVTLKPIHVNFDNLQITDMPGFGFMSGIKERKQDIVKDKIVHYFENNAQNINLAVMVIDGYSFLEIVYRWEQRGENPVDIELFNFLKELNIPVILVVNKMDKIKDNKDLILDEIAVKIGLSAPWKIWDEVIIPVSIKDDDIKKLSNCIKKRIRLAKRDNLLKFVR